MSDTNELSTALYEIAEREEFECTGVVPAAKLTVNPEVRGMCGVDRCKSFDTNELSTALYEIAEREEFECTGVVPAAKLTVNPEVRGMCGVDRCKSFAKNWMCPPYCGELDHFQRLIDERKTCFVVQTVKELEDEFDFEGMIDAEHAHKQRFRSFAREAPTNYRQRYMKLPNVRNSSAPASCLRRS